MGTRSSRASSRQRSESFVARSVVIPGVNSPGRMCFRSLSSTWRLRPELTAMTSQSKLGSAPAATPRAMASVNAARFTCESMLFTTLNNMPMPDAPQ
ncbi:MAG: hypothetical protein F4X91_01410 [Nitrospinae bacterium]|nr:hypothetical protein [Nitrospinota bacterium]